jgi:hypothetical protein
MAVTGIAGLKILGPLGSTHVFVGIVSGTGQRVCGMIQTELERAPDREEL